MRTAFTAVHVEQAPRSIGEYLKFRHDNVGAPFVLACVKFSLGSSVNLQQSALNRLHDLAMDHLGLVNDLYSFDKELRDFQTGKSKELINMVAVIKDVRRLDTWDTAKEQTYVLQLQREASISDEIRRLDETNALDTETWQYVEALCACLAGNAFYSMTTSRYGGEAAAVTPQSKAVAWSHVEADAPHNSIGSAKRWGCYHQDVKHMGTPSIWIWIWEAVSHIRLAFGVVIKHIL